MNQKDGKPNQPDKNPWTVSAGLMLIVLCGLSFYLGGIFYSEKDKYGVQDITRVVQAYKETARMPLQIKAATCPDCGLDFQDYTPCTDPKRWKKYSLARLFFLERHCPAVFERKECLVPPPDGYKSPIRWPKSRDECWYRNVPYDWINKQKSNQHWLKKEGEKFLFPGGGTMFPNGVGQYVDLMQDLIPEMKNGTIRTAIDTGCGVASWGGDLLDREILTVSLAPRDNHEAQVQFALERGILAMLGVIATQRLRSLQILSTWLIAQDALFHGLNTPNHGTAITFKWNLSLRDTSYSPPWGFWVLSGPPINYERRWKGWNTTIDEQRSNYEKLQELLSSMCFELYNKKDDIAVWQKLADNSCYKKVEAPENYPPKCDDGTEPDSAWYTPMRPCLVVPNQKYKKLALNLLPKWPKRLHTAPERVSDVRGGSGRAFKNDDTKWKLRVNHYKKLLPAIGTNKIRNVMDMNTVYGGFAASLIADPVWVMNVVSSYSPNTLAVVYDRGLIGTYHDWCEAFSTYPRTYDLLHLDALFTAESNRCEMKYVMLEMDRILRPNGYAVIRESSYFIDAVNTVAKGMKWACRKENTESGMEEEKILICQKKLWYSSKQTSR